MIKISDKGIVNLIRCIEENSQQYFWLRSADFVQQLYISDSFHHVWGRPIEQLFSHTMAYVDSLVPEDNKIIKLYHQRANDFSSEDHQPTILSRLSTPNGELKHLRDACFTLYDSYGNVLGMAGIGQVLTASEWEYDLQGRVAEPHPITAILKSLQEKHINITAQPVSADVQIPYKKVKRHYYINTTMGEVALTKRELETLNLLLAGKTAKESAKIMNISPRVVDEYLDNLRFKLNCRKKIEIPKCIKFIHSD